ncbi:MULTISPECIES: hypothetical protein [Agrobacterium tumefaciens complex]|jgi:hypothetical protein|uniref:hypothetical protein n=1 Tax=Agrobacterium tumefaciens complex TaxID=1183400 RepID=UPI0009BA0A85|nr:hypothetical protein [Agrobacterium tumefaciens]MDP9871841.1 hypothetical protein [Agrobacterium tumefaciens]MDP9976438.1 hypothetical protein [Agrobacterium tumefaciens]CUX21097.1 hypothetical protein AGR4B_Cc60800 [Agrobacterium tumefaciens str. CFBP 5621]
MFEVGKIYELTTLETGENYEGKFGTYESHQQLECVAVNGMLVQFRTPKLSFQEEELLGEDWSEEKIINTGSLFFHSAKLVEG